MIVRKQPNGELILICQTDHSRLVGQLAAHWGNRDFAAPKPYESVVRAACFHDYGWLSYETSPLINPETGEAYEFRALPFNPRQLEAYEGCIDWLAGIDRYSALIVSMHRTGLWQTRYQKITHPSGRYNPKGVRPEIQEFIARNEAWQAKERAAFDQAGVWTNYCLQQVWDLLGLYFCCQEPYQEHIEPVPTNYHSPEANVRLTMKPAGAKTVAFEPYPFNTRPLRVQIYCKRLGASSFPDVETFRRAYFQASQELLEYELA
jgi:hypothetical protein